MGTVQWGLKRGGTVGRAALITRNVTVRSLGSRVPISEPLGPARLWPMGTGSAIMRTQGVTMFRSRVLSSVVRMILVALAPSCLVALAEEHAGATGAAPPVRPAAVIAVVGDEVITDEALLSSLRSTSRNAIEAASGKAAEIEMQAIQQLFAGRYAQQEAARLGISVDDLYERTLNENRDHLPGPYRTQINETLSSIYELKRAALDDLIGRTLEEQAARSRGVTVEALLKSEVDDKVGPITDTDVDRFYDKYHEQMGSRTREAAAASIKAMLQKEQASTKRRQYRASLRAGAAVHVQLSPPRDEVACGSTTPSGDARAPVQIVVFSDFECPFCKKVEGVIKEVKNQYGNAVTVSFRDFPLPFHANAQKAAEAARCADAQGRYADFRDSLFADTSRLAPADLLSRAGEMGLDVVEFERCMEGGGMKAQIDADIADAGRLGVAGTPTVYINGRLVAGGGGVEDYRRIIDDELQLKGVRVPPTVEQTTTVASAALDR